MGSEMCIRDRSSTYFNLWINDDDVRISSAPGSFQLDVASDLPTRRLESKLADLAEHVLLF